MIRIAQYLVAAAAAGGLAAPALAQVPYPYPQQPYPPQYPQQYPGYPQQGYGQNPIQNIVDQLLGNRFNVTDRQAVQRCAAAAAQQASLQYRPNPYGQQGYGQYNQGYDQYGRPIPQPYAQPYAQGYGPAARVTAITNVERRDSGLRVSGVLDSGRFGPYANQGYNQGQRNYGYGSPYAEASGDLTFRCNVDYRGAVTNLRVRPNTSWRRR